MQAPKGSSQLQCQYGAGCRRPDCIYRHDGDGGGGAGGGSSGVCLPFLAGSCTFTNQGCRNYHPTNPDEIQRLKAKYKKIRCRFGDGCRTEGCLYLHPKEMQQVEPNYVLPLNNGAMMQSSFPPLHSNPAFGAGSSSGGGPSVPHSSGRPSFYPPASQQQQMPATVPTTAPRLPSNSAWKPTPPTPPTQSAWKPTPPTNTTMTLHHHYQQQEYPPQPQQRSNPWSMQQPTPLQQMPAPSMAVATTTTPPPLPTTATIGGGRGGSVWGSPSTTSGSNKPSFASVLNRNNDQTTHDLGGSQHQGRAEPPSHATSTNRHSGNFNVDAKEFVPSWST